MTFVSVAVEINWIKNLFSLVPKADSKIVQLDLFGVALVFFPLSLSSNLFLSLYISTDHLASMLI